MFGLKKYLASVRMSISVDHREFVQKTLVVFLSHISYLREGEWGIDGLRHSGRV